MMTPEDLARLFHTTYEDLAPEFAYETRLASRKPWELVPENNKKLMVAVAGSVMQKLGTSMGRQYRAIATALDVIDKLPDDSEGRQALVTIRAALRFAVDLEISEDDRRLLGVVDPDLLAMGGEGEDQAGLEGAGEAR
jgi:hypothetical protein